MTQEQGNISIQTENIFPIIKKWLYSEKDIFVRELVSNAADAISKMKKLAAIGEADIGADPKFIIRVIVNKDDNTLKIVDNGIGMSADEVKKYINQIAFSGARDFLEKYKDKAEESQIIGHFGLGFYSSFMVSEKVSIDTLSWQSGEKAVLWTSADGMSYEMTDSDRNERGTVVTLTLSPDSVEFLDNFKMREVLTKYFSFLPYEIYLEDVSAEAIKREKERAEEKAKAKAEAKAKAAVEAKKEVGTDVKTEAKTDAKTDEESVMDPDTADMEDFDDIDTADEALSAKPLNDVSPLWLKNPKDCTDEEYKEFFRKTFHDYNEPLFWIHLNMEYPFNLKGILYFPKLKHEFETMEGQIKLYYNQVFVADNIKEVIPEFLLLLKGTIDCPDLPLNVSRSFLQNDGYVSKLSTHITKKVADKLTALFENERENYNKFWDDIHPFVKYGCVREAKFFEKVKDIVIYKTTKGDYITLKEYLERNKTKHENKVFYVTDEKQQAQYIKLFKEHELEAVILPSMIDNHFMQFLEMKENTVKFQRIDSDLSESLKEAGSNDEAFSKEVGESLEALFKEALSNDKIKINVESLKSVSVPAIILLAEYSRRMQEMSRYYGGMDMRGMFPEEQTLVLNRKNHLIQALLRLQGREDRKEDISLICRHVYDLAMMSHKQLEADAMTGFIERSNRILEKLADVV